ncbi:MAG: peptidylprolyl isomerase [Cyanobacteria bacterium J06621_11]
MDAAIQIGAKSIDTPTLVNKMFQYRLLEKFVQESTVDDLIEGVVCDPTLALEAYCKRRKLETDEHVQAWCKQEHLTPGQMRIEALREAKLAQFKEDTWGDRLQTFFLQQKDQLDRVVYSLIRVKSAELAQELYFRLCDDGISFTDIAKQYSEGKEAQTGGLVGPVELKVPHPTIAKMLQVSEENQLWSPTKIGDWFVIVRFEKRIPAQMDETMRQRLLHEQFQALLKQQMQASPVKLLPNQDQKKQGQPTAKILEQRQPTQDKSKKVGARGTLKAETAQKETVQKETVQTKADTEANTEANTEAAAKTNTVTVAIASA